MGDLKKLLSMTPEERMAVAAGTDAPPVDNGQTYLTNPIGAELHQDPSTGKVIFKSSDASSDAGSSGSGGEARLGGRVGGRVNLADAERARAAYFEAQKAANNPMARQGIGGTNPNAESYRASAPAQEPHKMSPDELYKYAQDMLNQQEVQNSHALAMGPSTGSRDDAGGKTPAWLSDYMDKEDSLDKDL